MTSPLKLTAKKTPLQDVLVIEPKVFGDERGWFYESFNQQEFLTATGITIPFVQDNHSLSKQGILRGLHYQTHHVQGKLVRVTRGAVFDVAVDLRQSSPTFGQWVSAILSKENQKQLFIPEGFAHGYLTLSDHATFLYKTSQFYSPAHEGSIRWDDKTLHIHWPQAKDILVSPKDSQAISFDRSETYFI